MAIKTQDTIRQLASESSNRTVFYQRFLAYVVKQTEAVSGIGWQCSSPPFRPICQIQSPNHDVLRIGVSETEHAKILNQAVGNQKAVIIQPKAPTLGPQPSNASSLENPVIVLACVRNEATVELVELFFANGKPMQVYGELAKSIEEFCVVASNCDLPAPVDPADLPNSGAPDEPGFQVKRIGPSQLDEYVHQIHRTLEPSETAKQIVNEARRVLDCDRVSLVETKNNRCRIKAISGQPSVNNRSNTVHLLRKLCNRVLPTETSFWYPVEKKLPLEIEGPLQEYLAQAATRSLVVIPIFDQPPELVEQPDAHQAKQRLIGGLIIEHCSEEWTQDSVFNAVDVVSRHASDAYRNSFQHRQLLFYPVWKWLGKSQIVLAARNLSKTVAAVLGLIALSLLLAFFPADLRVSCEGVLVPQNRSNVFATIEGTVAEIPVKHGAKVEAGATLMKLVNLDLETQSVELSGKIKELERNVETTETLLLSRSSAEREIGEQSLNAQKEELASYQRQFDLVQRKLAKLTIVSPQPGQVVTWNLEERFRSRPVSRGDLLMEIVDVDGAWQLELDLPDQKIGHLLKAKAKSEEPLRVEFILAADPERKLTGTLLEIGRTTEIEPEKGQSVRLKVKIDDENLDIRQAKSGVTANVVCGETSLGNSLFIGVKEFCQKQWFRLF